MTNKRVEQKPSETALFAAIRRVLANKEYQNDKFGPDYLGEFFLPAHIRFLFRFKKVRENVRDKLNRFLPGLNEYMIARTAYFDRLFSEGLKDSIPQIVLLGAGYDTRAYRFSNLNNGTRIFELDIAPTQHRKKKCLEKAQIEIPQQVHFVPVNFNEESIEDVLDKAGYKSTEKTLFLWEGVSYYLELGSVDETLKYVSHFSHQESKIAFDYTISIAEEHLNEYYGVKEFTETMKKHHKDEALLFSLKEAEVNKFLNQRGLKIVEHLNTEDMEKTLLTDENGLSIGRVTGHFRFVLAASMK